ncbi:hypothetical protein AMATHDRAFT_5737 [Amanita thiersii Skay4041]|uniref:Major facilitator superfamily (MFS) profile domain-containing protein n=1 Tax=Amanita thiersii Skay4041 TaxID=703135 RepID=A0A2A9NLF1_9AGAR|nr:hypothetical protein AMATHDRAFT_5737 [Amanita thiersii Skay4041]
MSNNGASVCDEETALLTGKRKVVPTPLPKVQITVLLLLQLCDPICGSSIYPYINQLVSGLDITRGDERKVGYYVGMIESLYYATEAMTVLQWGRASDQFGRKPVLLFGLFGVSLSILSFGLSRTFWGLVISRCLCGLLNGNLGVMKSTMAELTDPTNRAEGFALTQVTWSGGLTIGPMIGGTFARPHERFPRLFTGDFWKEYPYFLPCGIVTGFNIVAFLVALLFFKETLPERSSDVPLNASKPIPIRQLFTYPVLISVSNYVVLAFLEIALLALIPLFMAMPIEIGGLGFSPAVIGFVLGCFGVGFAMFQVLLFARIIRRFGERRVFIAGMVTLPLMFASFPVMSMIAKNYGVTWMVWAILGCTLSLMVIMNMGYCCIFIYITTSAPNKRSLGATNGLSQTTVSIARAIGPALATAMFSFSVENNLLWGYGVYFAFFLCGCLAVPLSMCLPNKVWDEKD